MSRVLVIGCGGVANVAIRKCCQVSEVFTELCIASRTKSKCDALAEALNEIGATHARNALDFEWAGLRFFVTHGDDRKLLTDAIESQNYDVVCSGHTHVFATGTEGKTLVVNPGAIKFGSFVIIHDKKNVLHNPD